MERLGETAEGSEGVGTEQQEGTREVERIKEKEDDVEGKRR